MISNYLLVVKNFVLKNKVNTFFLILFIVQTICAGRIWVWNIFSIIPPIFFTLIYVIWIIWNINKSNLVGLSVVLFCLPMAIYSSDISLRFFVDQPSEDSATVKVFNWNTQFWEENDKPAFFKFLLAQNADVYQLQEHIKLQNGYFIELDDLDEIKDYFKGYTVVKKTEFLTITKLPVVQSFKEDESYYLRVDVQVKKNVLSLYNVHMPVQINPAILPDFYRFAVDLKHRYDFRNQEYAKLVNDIKSNKNEYYISGDFNTTKSMGKIHEILELGKDAVYAGDTMFNGTWAIEGLKLWRIDFNIAHPGLKIMSYKEVDPGNFSDHWAQIVSVQL